MSSRTYGLVVSADVNLHTQVACPKATGVDSVEGTIGDEGVELEEGVALARGDHSDSLDRMSVLVGAEGASLVGFLLALFVKGAKYSAVPAPTLMRSVQIHNCMNEGEYLHHLLIAFEVPRLQYPCAGLHADN